MCYPCEPLISGPKWRYIALAISALWVMPGAAFAQPENQVSQPKIVTPVKPKTIPAATTKKSPSELLFTVHERRDGKQLQLVLPTELPRGRDLTLVAEVPDSVASAQMFMWRAGDSCQESEKEGEPVRRLSTTLEEEGAAKELKVLVPRISEPWWKYCFRLELYRLEYGVPIDRTRARQYVHSVLEVWLDGTRHIRGQGYQKLAREAGLLPDCRGNFACQKLSHDFGESLVNNLTEVQKASDEAIQMRNALSTVTAHDTVLGLDRTEVSFLTPNNFLEDSVDYQNEVALALLRRFEKRAETFAARDKMRKKRMKTIVGSRAIAANKLAAELKKLNKLKETPVDLADTATKEQIAKLEESVKAVRAREIAATKEVAVLEKLLSESGRMRDSIRSYGVEPLQQAIKHARSFLPHYKAAVASLRKVVIQVIKGDASTAAGTASTRVDRAKGYFTADIGAGMMFSFEESDEIAPFARPVGVASIGIGFSEVDYEAGLADTDPPKDVSDCWFEFKQRFMVSVGFALPITRPSVRATGKIRGAFDDVYLVTGVGFRLSDFVKLSAGVMIGRYESATPGRSDRLIFPGYLGLSIDAPVYQWLAGALRPSVQ